MPQVRFRALVRYVRRARWFLSRPTPAFFVRRRVHKLGGRHVCLEEFSARLAPTPAGIARRRADATPRLLAVFRNTIQREIQRATGGRDITRAGGALRGFRDRHQAAQIDIHGASDPPACLSSGKVGTQAAPRSLQGPRAYRRRRRNRRAQPPPASRCIRLAAPRCPTPATRPARSRCCAAATPLRKMPQLMMPCCLNKSLIFCRCHVHFQDIIVVLHIDAVEG